MPSKFLLYFLSLLLLSFLVRPDTFSTIAYFNVPTSLTFTVTLPGGPANTNSTYSSDIEFNASSNNAKNVTPCVAGGGSCQTSTTPIFLYTNTGNVNLNFTVQLSSNVTNTSVIMGSSNSSSFYAKSDGSGCNAAGTNASNWSCVNVTSEGASYCFNGTYVINPNTAGQCWVWANFFNLYGGNRFRRTLTHTSVQG